MIGKYRKKPIVIEAVQFTGTDENWHDIVNFLDEDDFVITANGLIIKTLEGKHLASKGDFIIKGIKGEFYPCKPDIFKETYEEA